MCLRFFVIPHRTALFAAPCARTCAYPRIPAMSVRFSAGGHFRRPIPYRFSVRFSVPVSALRDNARPLPPSRQTPISASRFFSPQSRKRPRAACTANAEKCSAFSPCKVASDPVPAPKSFFLFILTQIPPTYNPRHPENCPFSHTAHIKPNRHAPTPEKMICKSPSPRRGDHRSPAFFKVSFGLSPPCSPPPPKRATNGRPYRINKYRPGKRGTTSVILSDAPTPAPANGAPAVA